LMALLQLGSLHPMVSARIMWVRTKGNAEELANYCSTIDKLLETMGNMHKKAGVLDLEPYHGFVHCGGKFTLFVGKKYYAVADETADWNEVSWASLQGKFPEGV